MVPRSQQILRLLFAIPLAGAWATAGHAASTLTIPAPADPTRIEAVTYDVQGKPIGKSSLGFETQPDGKVRMIVRSGVDTGTDTGAAMEAEALLEPIDGGKTLRLLSETSETFGPGRKPRGLMKIDHIKGTATCIPAAGSDEKGEVKIPQPDRSVNVPLNLYFLPLVNGEAEEMSFQMFICGGGARMLDFNATVVKRASGAGEAARKEVVEVSYVPDLGPLLSWVAGGIAPKLRFWLEQGSGSYQGHLMPLYTRGPEVIVAREGVTPKQIGAAE